MSTDIDDAPTTTATNNKENEVAKKPRGAGFTRTEDILACKSFIAASEDPFVGTSQKGRDFKKKMHEKYKELLVQQAKLDQLKYLSAPAGAKELLPPPQVYETRNPDSVHSRFKDTISARILKFLAVEETTQQDSGSDDEQFYQKCKLIFERRYPTFGNFDDLRMCKDYLKDKAKYLSFRKIMEAGNTKKVERPTSSKKAKQDEVDKKLIESALKEAGCITEGSQKNAQASRSGMDKVVGVLETLGKSVLEFWSREEDSKFLALLDTPDRKRLVKEQLETRLAAEHAKRRQHEQLPTEVVLPAATASSSSDTASSKEGSALSSDKEEAGEKQRKKQRTALCCAGEYCFHGPAGNAPLTHKCALCSGACHADCFTVNAELDVMCDLCAKEEN